MGQLRNGLGCHRAGPFKPGAPPSKSQEQHGAEGGHFVGAWQAGRCVLWAGSSGKQGGAVWMWALAAAAMSP